MGAGRKTRTILVPEKSAIPTSVNSRGTARNLRTSELCGAIFGCKNATIVECFSNLLFGLPGSHYSYVKNIKPGFPLFLFNYSTRMLYGIFEAVSSGGWNINPHAWTDGSDTTQFPAQVKVQILMQCKPLREDQFSTIISENYFHEGFFWFELDQDQTSNLISLFSSFPTTWVSLPEPTHKSKTSAEGSHASIVRQQVENIELSDPNLELRAGEGAGALSGANLELCVGKGVGDTPPQQSWISLFRSGNPWVPSEQTMDAMLPQEPSDAFFNSEADDVRESWEELESPPEETKEMKDLPAEKEIWDSSSNGKVMTKEDSHDEHLMVQSEVAEMFFDTISKLSTEVEGLKLSQSVQDQKICRLEYELEKSRMEIQLLRHRCKKLESSETSKSTSSY